MIGFRVDVFVFRVFGVLQWLYVFIQLKQEAIIKHLLNTTPEMNFLSFLYIPTSPTPKQDMQSARLRAGCSGWFGGLKLPDLPMKPYE